MKNLLNFTVRIFIIVVLLTWSGNIFSQGSSMGITSKEYNPGQFDGIKIGGSFEVKITQGENNLVKVVTEEKFQDKIKIAVNDGVLEIDIEGSGLKMPKEIDIFITFNELSSIVISGATELESLAPVKLSELFIKSSGASEIKMELNVDKLTVDLSGAGEVKLSGEAKEFNASVSGAGELKSKDLVTEITRVEASGAGNAYINVTNTIECDVSGAANVDYTGSPENKNITKSGGGNITSKDLPDEEMMNIDINEDDEYVNVRVGNMGIEVMEDEDTTRISIGKHKITIDDHGNVKYNKCKTSKFDGHWAGIDLGVNGYLTKDWDLNIPPEYNFLDIKQEKSWTLSVNPFEQNFNLARNHLGLITGIGLQWINYRFDDNIFISGDSATIYGFQDISRNYNRSKLTICYVNIPILLEYQTNRHMKANSFHLTGGMVFGLRLGSHSKMVYEDGGKQKFKTRDDFHLNPFKLDATVRIGWGWINLFGTYSINTLFRDNKGPELYPFTAGITLVGW